MERPGKPTRARRGVCESALQLRAVWEGDRREAKVSTGLGKAHRPGSQGGLRKRGPWWNEAPTSPIERASAGNSPPKVVRAADLSRPASAAGKAKQGRHHEHAEERPAQDGDRHVVQHCRDHPSPYLQYLNRAVGSRGAAGDESAPDRFAPFWL